MDISSYIRECCQKKNITVSKLAELSGQSQPNLAKKLRLNNFKISELEKLVSGLDSELSVRFIDKETGEPL